MAKQKLTEQDYAEAAALAQLPITDIKTVAMVESRGAGFDDNDLPIILFEGHQFSKMTGHKFDQSNPTVSYPQWTTRFYSKGATATVRNTKEHMRLAEAAALDRNAALQSASWGLFQLMGFNYKNAGFKDIQAFINAHYESEGTQLLAFTTWIMNERKKRLDGSVHRLVDTLREHRWADFAFGYNGEGYAVNKYDVKLAATNKDLLEGKA